MESIAIQCWISGIALGFLVGACAILVLLYRREKEFWRKQRSKHTNVEEALSDISDKIEARTSNRAAFLASIMGLFLAVFYFQYGGRLKEITDDIQQHAAETEVKLRAELAANTKELQLSTQERYLVLEADIRKGISERLKEEAVTKVIETQSRERVEDITERFITNKAKEILDPKVFELDTKINIVRSELDFASTTLNAEAGDRRSFDNLLKIVNDPNHARNHSASIIAQYIANQLPRGVFAQISDQIKAAEILGLNKTPVDIIALKREYYASPQGSRAAIIRLIWASRHLSRIEKVDFSIDVLNHDQFLDGMRIACRELRNVAEPKQQIGNLFHYQSYIRWWEDNRQTLTKSDDWLKP